LSSTEEEKSMVIIEITNVEEILSAKIGSFAAKIVQALADDEGKVEEVLIKELQANFQERGLKLICLASLG
jgi:hypothetical protein